MFSRILLVAMFLLLAWNSYELTTKNESLKSQNQDLLKLISEVRSKQELQAKQLIKQSALLNKNNAIQESILLKFKSIDKKLKVVNFAKKVDPKKLDKTEKPVRKILPSTKKAPSIFELNERLKQVKTAQKDGQIEKASTQLLSIKKDLWKLRKNKNLTKERVVSVMSSIDIVINKWKNKETIYTIDKIEEKLKTLSLMLETSK